jgi:hypothetical protein
MPPSACNKIIHLKTFPRIKMRETPHGCVNSLIFSSSCHEVHRKVAMRPGEWVEREGTSAEEASARQQRKMLEARCES